MSRAVDAGAVGVEGNLLCFPNLVRLLVRPGMSGDMSGRATARAVSAPTAGTYRKRLLAAGLITSVGRGWAAFADPTVRRYI